MEQIFNDIGAKSIARLFRLSLESGGAYEFINEDIDDLMENLLKFPKRTIAHLFREAALQIKSSEDKMTFLKMIESTSPECFSTFQSFNVFGCRLSTDIDVAVVVDNVYLPLLSSEKQRFMEELTELGYDPGKKIDVSLISRDEKGWFVFKKGGKELQNILIYTYNVHKQKYPLITDEEVTIDILNKCMTVFKYILDNLEILIPLNTYRELRDERIQAYSGGYARIDFAINSYQYFILDPLEWNKSVWKTLMVKLIQLVVLHSGMFKESEEFRTLYFQKEGLAKLFRIYCKRHLPDLDLEPAVDLVTKMLLRIPFEESDVYNTDVIDVLHKKLFSIIQEFDFPLQDWPVQKLDVESLPNPTPVSDELYALYKVNPVDMTEDFCSKWIETFEDTRIDTRFQEELLGLDTLEAFHPKVFANTEIVKQRSAKWKELLTFYTCGNNTGVNELPEDLTPEQIITARSNLLMGCFGECIVASGYDFTKLVSEFTKVNVGMVVNEKGIENSPGSCPDLLLVNEKEIVPVEIKMINGEPKDNKNYFRSFSLAKKQVEGCGEILNHSMPGVSTRGIMILTWVYKKGDVWHYDSFGGLITFQ
jgi:hypothetical protein